MWHLVRPTDEVDEGKSKRGSMKEKEVSEIAEQCQWMRQQRSKSNDIQPLGRMSCKSSKTASCLEAEEESEFND